ncbi:MAG: TrkH family potassium uptake protein [Rhodobacteraceae bacterium]|jgi:trk system potassium uptake protein TrkH|nr:TrkH family potassium uptake protein [Paracoccaceae bacterium]
MAAGTGRAAAARLARLPMPVLLLGMGGLAMLVPAAHAAAVQAHGLARAFLYPGLLCMVVTVLLALATAGHRPRDATRGDLATMAAAFAALPVVFTLPFRVAVPDTTWFNAWFEMVSSFTTTGASLYDAPGRLPPTVHLWRALVGWLGGLFMLVTAAAVLAPMNLGGFEVLSGQPGTGGGRGPAAADDRARRVLRATAAVAPAYALLTGALWIMLMIAGERALVAGCHAMSTLATSAISPVQGMAGSTAGLAGEMLVFLFLVFALSRRTLPGAPRPGTRRGLGRDPELRLGLLLVLAAAAILFLRHFLGALDDSDPQDIPAAAGALWGGLFTVASFLTTTGFVSDDWAAARIWSDLRSPGLILLGLALIGGGVATTAGGVKLLRVYTLLRQGERELERIIHPSSLGGEGPEARRLRREGAHLAWLFFMLFAFSIAVVAAALAFAGQPFETALVFTYAALSTTGPLVQLAADSPLSWAGLATAPKAILAAAMILGRLETLAVIALLAPPAWRD